MLRFLHVCNGLCMLHYQSSILLQQVLECKLVLVPESLHVGCCVRRLLSRVVVLLLMVGVALLKGLEGGRVGSVLLALELRHLTCCIYSLLVEGFVLLWGLKSVLLMLAVALLWTLECSWACGLVGAWGSLLFKYMALLLRLDNVLVRDGGGLRVWW